MTPPAPPLFRVDWSLCRSQVTSLRDHAFEVGISARLQLANELKTVRKALENEPMEWGEPYQDQVRLGLTNCVGFSETFAVRYGVHLQNRIVFVRSIRLKR